jgi:DNA repair protein RecO (recombination protein O)
MEEWKDQGILLSAKLHAENGAIVSLLTKEHGRHLGYIKGAHSKRNRALLQPGTIVSAQWRARIVDSLGTYKLEEEKQIISFFLDEPLKLSALQSACSLCNATLPERERHKEVYDGFLALLDTLHKTGWEGAYIYWEIALLRELGFSLDFSRCASGSDSTNLYYMSPKSGRAVSYEAGYEYKDRLLELPDFLKPKGYMFNETEILKGLKLTGYFLNNWVFGQHSTGIPEERLRFENRFAKTVIE